MTADTPAAHSPADVEGVASAKRLRAPHVAELDGIRGIAILGVMLLHFVGGMSPESRAERMAAKLSTYGVWGVDLFFVLSGFLITGILYDAKGSSRYFRNFYARRTLRIFPLYYAVLLILAAIPAGAASKLLPTLASVQHVQGWLWSYLTNIYVARAGSFSIPYVSHFWSLAVEEHFYLVWPFLVSLLSRAQAQRACLVLGLVALALRVAISFASSNEVAALVLTPCRLDALCAGAWFALALRGAQGRAATDARAMRWIVPLAGSVLALSAWHAVIGRGDALVLPLRGTALSLFFGAAMVICTAASGPRSVSKVLRSAWLRALGKYSYGLYVFHGIVAYFSHEHHLEARCTAAVGSHAAAVAIVASAGFSVSVAVAVASYELFERPVLKLKRWFEYRPESAAIHGPSATAAPESSI